MVDGGGRRGGARARKAGIVAGALGAGLGIGLAVERYLVGRERLRPDPEAREPLGDLRGRAIGPVASFDGTLLHVEEAGSGPTLVLLHGFSLSLVSWHYQIKHLARDYRLVLYDHRGHGRSGSPPEGTFTLDALARDLDAVLAETCPDEPAVVVGHSMGGMTALRYAGLFGEALGPRVAGLVLVDTTAADVMDGIVPGARRAKAVLQAVQEAAMRALASDPRRAERMRARATDLAFLGTRLMGFGPRPSPAQVAFVERMLADTPTEVWTGLLPTIASLDVADVLEAIDVPVLVAVGSHDRLTPPGAAERMAAAIPGAELAVIRGGGHMAMLEKPHAFHARLRHFLARVPGFGRSSAPTPA